MHFTSISQAYFGNFTNKHAESTLKEFRSRAHLTFGKRERLSWMGGGGGEKWKGSGVGGGGGGWGGGEK